MGYSFEINKSITVVVEKSKFGEGNYVAIQQHGINKRRINLSKDAWEKFAHVFEQISECMAENKPMSEEMISPNIKVQVEEIRGRITLGFWLGKWGIPFDKYMWDKLRSHAMYTDNLVSNKQHPTGDNGNFVLHMPTKLRGIDIGNPAQPERKPATAKEMFELKVGQKLKFCDGFSGPVNEKVVTEEMLKQRQKDGKNYRNGFTFGKLPKSGVSHNDSLKR